MEVKRRASGDRRMSVLIVDDEPTIRRLLRLTLTTAGYEVLEAASGEDGLACAAAGLPDAILLDYTLPGMDGIATAEALRANPATANILTILMSASIRLRKHGDTPLVDGTLAKPFSIEAVTACVASVLAHPA